MKLFKKLILVGLLIGLSGCGLDNDAELREALNIVSSYLGDIYKTPYGFEIEYKVRPLPKHTIGYCKGADGPLPKVYVDMEQAESSWSIQFCDRVGRCSLSFESFLALVVAHEAAHCAFLAKHTEKNLIMSPYLNNWIALTDADVEHQLITLNKFLRGE